MRKRSPVILAANLALFALTAAVAIKLAGLVADPLRVLLWFAGAIVLHDFVLLPAYSAIDRLLVRGVNVIRVPALLSGLLLLVWFPLILSRDAPLYESVTGSEQPDYLLRWLVISGVLFAASPLVAAAWTLRTRRRAAAPGP
jgi:hypothetical protein